MTGKLVSTSKLQPGMQAYEMSSEYVRDTLTIRVALPASYDFSPQRYPVLYVLDGDASFGLATTAMAYINLGANFGMGKNIPEMIVVSIGYERGAIPWLLTRVRDLTPTPDPTFNYNNPNFVVPASGQAEQFYQFMRQELMPALQAQYRIDPALNVLATHSMGGVFAAYTMFHAEPVFQKILMACPFVGWDNKVIFKTEEKYARQHKQLKADVFLAITGSEPTPFYIAEVNEFYETLLKRNYQDFHCTLVDYPDHNHFSVWAKTFIDGLIYLFNV